MFSAAIILVFSAALFLFYLQVTCEKILRRRFLRELGYSIADANRLEFPFVRRALEEFDAPVEYARFRMQLKCDYLALTYLLRNAANERRRLSRHERLLAFYFRGLSATLAAFHLMRLPEKPIFLKMTVVLEYFANVLGERIQKLRFGPMTASEYLMSL